MNRIIPSGEKCHMKYKTECCDRESRGWGCEHRRLKKVTLEIKLELHKGAAI